MGIMEYGDMVIENYCDPIVSPELWQQVQEVGRKHAHISAEHNPRRLSSAFLFSGIVFCQHCGSPLNGHVIAKAGKKRREYYSCMRKARRRDCAAREIPRLPLEAEVIHLLEDLALDLERMLIFQARVREYYEQMSEQVSGELRRVRRDARDQARRISNLVDAIAERGHSHSLILALQKAEADQAALRMQVEAIERKVSPPPELAPIQLKDIAAEISSALHGDDMQKKRHALGMLAARIVVSRSDAHIRGVVQFVPAVCLGGGAPAGAPTERIHFTIPIARYTKREVGDVSLSR
jgi:hypothetical protein